VQLGECGQGVAECDAFGKNSFVFVSIIGRDVTHQGVEPVPDRVFRVRNTLPQPRPVRLKQRDIEE
jgi:hypothetical protein